MYNYEKKPDEIYRRSFETIQREADLSGFDEDEKELVVRMIHASGMVDLAADVVISPGAIASGRAALAARQTIVCDVHMVQQGIIRSRLPHNNSVLCNVRSAKARVYGQEMNTTRSAGGIESLEGDIEDGILAIGNAPTALFHLLEMLDRGVKPPALVIGCPVGFVGAVESKQALIDHHSGVPFITVRGRRGGSAIAAAAVNALSRPLAKD